MSKHKPTHSILTRALSLFILLAILLVACTIRRHTDR